MISLKSNLRLMAKQGSFEDFFCSKISASPIDHTNAVWFLARGVQKIVLFAFQKQAGLQSVPGGPTVEMAACRCTNENAIKNTS
mmetsp:Transcript_8116/g.20122  ORF Transcript_8116/g.20122 Transcript_8116/m.20122 type:complete len:84 (+) Transcript_8116:274-525(+)